jgi:hypothetical protein
MEGISKGHKHAHVVVAVETTVFSGQPHKLRLELQKNKSQ